MTKTERKIKKDIKRKLLSIGYKKSCRDLKNEFLKEFKTAIYDSSYISENNSSNFHPNWINFPQPYLQEIEEDGYVEEFCSRFLPLNISKASIYIMDLYKKYNEKVVVTCYNFQKNEESWVVI